jgi:hypothetical protein
MLLAYFVVCDLTMEPREWRGKWKVQPQKHILVQIEALMFLRYEFNCDPEARLLATFSLQK